MARGEQGPRPACSVHLGPPPARGTASRQPPAFGPSPRTAQPGVGLMSHVTGQKHSTASAAVSSGFPCLDEPQGKRSTATPGAEAPRVSPQKKNLCKRGKKKLESRNPTGFEARRQTASLQTWTVCESCRIWYAGWVVWEHSPLPHLGISGVLLFS